MYYMFCETRRSCFVRDSRSPCATGGRGRARARPGGPGRAVRDFHVHGSRPRRAGGARTCASAVAVERRASIYRSCLLRPKMHPIMQEQLFADGSRGRPGTTDRSVIILVAAYGRHRVEEAGGGGPLLGGGGLALPFASGAVLRA